MVRMIGLGSICCGLAAGILPLSSGQSGRPSGSDLWIGTLLGFSGGLLDVADSAGFYVSLVGLSVDWWLSGSGRT